MEPNNKVTKYINTVVLIIFVLLTLIFIEKIFIDNTAHSYEETTIYLRYFYYAILALAVVFYFGGKTKLNSIILFTSFTVIGLAIIFIDKTYSIVDESAHFDYINQIVVNYKLPILSDYLDNKLLYMTNGTNIPDGIINHEAVHPPFYYMVMASLTFMIKEHELRFLFIRCMGLLILLSIIFVTYKTLEILYKNKIIYLDHNEVFYFVLLFLMNPGILLRFTRVSNESLAALLTALIVYILIKALFNCFHDKLWWTCNLLLISLFLTKITGIIYFSGIVIILFYQKKYIRIIQSCIIFALGVSPWLFYNLFIYHSFTGMKEHLEYILPIVNPNKVREDLIPNIISLFTKYINPEETGYNKFNSIISNFFSTAIIIIVILFLLYSVKNCYCFIKNKFNFNYEKFEKKKILIILVTTIIVENIFILFLGSYTTLVNVLIGRYLYVSAIPLIILGIFWIQDKEEYVRKFIYMIFAIAISTGYISSISTALNSYAVH